MASISFNHEFLDALLRGDKQQTTRKQTDRIKVDDIAPIYIEQRGRITDKPLRRLTDLGRVEMTNRIFNDEYNYPPSLTGYDHWNYYAHFIGKLEITEVYDIHPCEMSGEALKAWALADGFKDFHPTTIPPDRLYDGANMWFQLRYGDDWMQKMWTVIQWGGWDERYFEPENL